MSDTLRRLRRARPEDIDALVRLEQAFPSDRLGHVHFRRLLMRGNADIWVYEEAGRVLGEAVVLYRRGVRSARLYSLMVDPACQGQGIGRFMLEAAERAACERGCERMRLEVRVDNVRAIRLYCRTGYAATDWMEGFYEDRTDALRMCKTLNGVEAEDAPAGAGRGASLRARTDQEHEHRT